MQGGARPKQSKKNAKKRAANRDGSNIHAIESVVVQALQGALSPIQQRLLALEAGKNTPKKDKQSSQKGSSNRRPRRHTESDDTITRELKRMGIHNRDSSTDTDSDTGSEDNTSGGDISPPTPRKRNNKGKQFVSGRDLTAENCADCKAPWPHHMIWKGTNMRGATYDSLDYGEFVFGFMDQADSHKFRRFRKQMMRYFKNFAEDVKDRPGEWAMLRNWHGIFLTLWERGAIKWTSHDRIAKMKARHIMTTQQEHERAPQMVTKTTQDKYNPCGPYNRGECTREGSHSGLNHICSHCWRNKGRVNRHPEKACYALVGGPPKKRSSQF